MPVLDLGYFDPLLIPAGGAQAINLRGLPYGRGHIVIYNDSGVNLQFTLGAITKRVLAGTIDEIDTLAYEGGVNETLYGRQDIILPNVSQWPISRVALDGYPQGTPFTMQLPMAIPRTANVGNQVQTSATQSISNVGNPPANLLIQAMPNDQTQNAIYATNDGALLWEVLDNGALRNVFNIVRGSATAPATVVIGDINDSSLVTIHGNIDNASHAGQATTAVSSQQTNSVLMYDGGLSQQNSVSMYEGAVDPSTYLVPAVGDIWFEG